MTAGNATLEELRAEFGDWHYANAAEVDAAAYALQIHSARRCAVEMGLCSKCGGRRAPKRRLCRSCLDIAAERARRVDPPRTRTRKRIGCCVRCTRPASPGRTMCEAHLEWYAAYRERRRALGRTG